MIQFGCMIIRHQVCFDSLVRFRRPSIQRKPGTGLSLQSQPGNAKQALMSFRKYVQRFSSKPLDKQINHKSVVMSSTSTTITRTLMPWGLCKLQDEAWSKQPAGSSWKKSFYRVLACVRMMKAATKSEFSEADLGAWTKPPWPEQSLSDVNWSGIKIQPGSDHHLDFF